MKNFNKTATFLFLICFIAGSATAQTWQWARTAGGPENDYANGVTADDSGNSYVTGRFYNSISFGSTMLTNPGLWSVYIAKYDVNGSLAWAKIVAGDSAIYVNGISVDNTREFCITGRYFGTATFGTTNPVSLTSTGDFDVFIAKYDSAGEIRWAKSAGGPGIDYGIAIGNDAQHNVFVTGDFHLNSFPVSASKVFIAKYDSNGNNSWLTMSQSYGNFHYGNGMKTDSLGNCYITGQFFDSIAFDSLLIHAGNVEANIYIAKFDSSGNLVWGQKAGAGSGYASGEAIEIDDIGNAYVTGLYRGTISFGSLSLTGPPGLYYGTFIAKCDTVGNFLWAKKASGNGTGRALCKDGAGGFYMAGYFSDTMTFGTTSLINTGGGDIFIAKINSSGNFLWATHCGGLPYMNLGGMKANSTGIFITGNFTDTIYFDSLSLTANSSIKYDIFLGKLSSTTGVKEEQHLSFEAVLFPNPATNEIQLKNVHGKASYIICDVLGKVMSNGIAGETKKISVANLENGIYFIQLKSENEFSTRKFIVQH